jgi:hypothetical protein
MKWDEKKQKILLGGLTAFGRDILSYSKGTTSSKHPCA